MLDSTKERLISKIEELDGFFKDLGTIKLEDPKLDKVGNLHGTAMLLFSIINATLDLADDIKIANKLGKNNKYSEIVELLEQNKLIDEDAAFDLNFLISQRNILAHEYGRVSKGTIFDVWEKINSVYSIIELAKDTIRKDL